MKKWAFIVTVGIVAAVALAWWSWGRRPQTPVVVLNPNDVRSVVITTNGERFPAGRVVITDRNDIEAIASTFCGAYEAFPFDGCLYSMNVELVVPGKSRTVVMAVCCFGHMMINHKPQYCIRSKDIPVLRKTLAKYGFLWIPERKWTD